VTRADLLDLLRRSRASLDSLLGLTGDEDADFQEAIFDAAEEVASTIASALAPPSDPGGPLVRSAIPDDLPGGMAASLQDRVREIEEDAGSPLRSDPTGARARIRRALLDAAVYAVQASDPTLTVLVAALIDDLDLRGRVGEA